MVYVVLLITKMQNIILLTGCINPNGMSFTSLTDISIRINQYITAIDFYLKNTDLPIVFAENSDTDIKRYFSINNKRLEIISFKGNNDKERGKGYGEAEIIEYALNNSIIITASNSICNITKITGRLLINNITNVINQRFLFQNKNSIVVSFNSDFSFADSRIIIAPKAFYHSFLKRKEEINDSINNYFEIVLSDFIKNEKLFDFYPFYIEPQIYGQSGTTSEIYRPHEDSFKRRLSYLSYATHQILLFNKHLTKKKLSNHIMVTYKFLYLFYKAIEKVLATSILIFKRIDYF